MDKKVIDLLIQRMDDHKDESNRRFDQLSLDIVEVKKEVKSISQWRWKIGGGVVAVGIFFSFMCKVVESMFEKLK